VKIACKPMKKIALIVAWPATHIRRALADRKAIASLEFAAVVPVLLMIVMSVIYISIVFNNYLELNNAVSAGARMLAASRGASPPSAYSNATTAFLGAIPNLTTSSPPLSYTMLVGGTACNSDGAGGGTCDTLLNASMGGTAQVTATYTCNVSFMGINLVPGCTLSAQSSEPIL
jgi:Flp pilus assembly protein TadG